MDRVHDVRQDPAPRTEGQGMRATGRLRAWLLGGLLLGGSAAAAALELTAEEAAGKQIYLHGTSASANALIHARVGAVGTAMPASVVPCVGCHGSDGRGRREGGVRPPDITWRRLSAPYGQKLPGGRRHPAYGEASFARALSEGVDPAGNRLDPAMPRFVMSQRDMASLIAYIKRLEDDRDPGLHESVLRLGTLLPAEGPLAALGRTVAAVLRGVLEGINETGGIHGRRLELVVADSSGGPARAEAALRELIERRDVFALVAPLAPVLEGRYAELLEGSGMPLIGPLVQFADGDGSRLVFDPLPGLREQMFALAAYADEQLGLGDPETLVVYPDEPRHRALAEMLAGNLQQRGWRKVHLLRYGDEVVVDRPLEAGLEAVFFLGLPEAFLSLASALQDSGQPPWLFASSNQVAGSALRVPPGFSGRLLLAYPFLPGDWTPAGAAALQEVRRRGGLNGQHAALQVSTYSAALVLAEGLKRAGRDASREKLLTALENLHAFQTGVTPELGFGPGRRIGAPGAHIVTVDLRQRLFRPTGRYLKVDTP